MHACVCVWHVFSQSSLRHSWPLVGCVWDGGGGEVCVCVWGGVLSKALAALGQLYVCVCRGGGAGPVCMCVRGALDQCTCTLEVRSGIGGMAVHPTSDLLSQAHQVDN